MSKCEEYTQKQIKRKLENVLRVFKTSENIEMINMVIEETSEKMRFIIAESTIRELRDSFYQQNFSCWNNVFELDRNKKYY